MNDTAIGTIRRARPEDDLSFFYGGDIGRHSLNTDAILVAETARGIEGMLVIFDGGHSVVYVDHFVVRDDAPKDTGALLLLALNECCELSGKTGIFAVSGSLELAYLGKQRGAIVEGPLFRIRYDVKETHCHS